MAHPNPLPDLSLLRELLFIDESSPSGLRWRIGKVRGVRPDRVAGGVCSSTGYWRVRINSKRHLVHRVIYFMHHGIDPIDLVIDHIDRNKTNNKIENLRMVDYSANARNTKIDRLNTSGRKGVHFDKYLGKYRAQITTNGNCIRLGLFNSREDAIAARKAGEIKFWGQNYL